MLSNTRFRDDISDKWGESGRRDRDDLEETSNRFDRGPGWGYGPDPGYQVPVVGPSQPLVRPEDEVSYLEGCAKQLEEDLKAIKDRLAELRKK